MSRSGGGSICGPPLADPNRTCTHSRGAAWRLAEGQAAVLAVVVVVLCEVCYVSVCSNSITCMGNNPVVVPVHRRL